MKYLASWQVFIWLGDTLSDSWWFNCQCDLRLPYLYVPDFKKKILFVEKNDGLKNRPFFITENFLGILNRLSMEPFSPWHWPLLGQHLLAVIFFCSVDVCQSVFCVF